MDWGQINQAINRCRALTTSRDRFDCLRKLYDETLDGNVAYALGEEHRVTGSLIEAIKWYEAAAVRYPLEEFRQRARLKAEEVRTLMQRTSSAREVLVVVGCTYSKIWDYNERGHRRSVDDLEYREIPRFVPACIAYVGDEFRRWMTTDRYNEKLSILRWRWIILSGKYGFIEPWHPIEDYDVKLANDKNTVDWLKGQALQQERWHDQKKIIDFETIVAYCPEDYYLVLQQVLGNKILTWEQFLGAS
jgi:hypothetical protein